MRERTFIRPRWWSCIIIIISHLSFRRFDRHLGFLHLSLSNTSFIISATDFLPTIPCVYSMRLLPRGLFPQIFPRTASVKKSSSRILWWSKYFFFSFFNYIQQDWLEKITNLEVLNKCKLSRPILLKFCILWGNR